MNLYPFQVTGAEWLWRMGRGLLGDHPGLGKTAQAIWATPPDCSTIVVCPAVMKYTWQAEYEKWKPGTPVTVLSGRNSLKRWPEVGEVVVLNWDILPPSFPPGFPKNLCLILDEGQYAKDATAQRTRKVRALARLAKRVYLLSGTPLQNEPIDLWNVLETAKLAEAAFGSWPEFVRLFEGRQIDLGSKAPGGRRWTKWVWGKVHPSVPDRLRRVMLRRRRVDVLPELPAKTYRDVVVDIADKEALRKCDEAAEELRKAGIDLDAAQDRADLDSVQGDALGALARARAALSEAKLPWAIQVVRELEEQFEPVVFFSAHRSPVEVVGAAPGWKTILGGTPALQREEAVALFQAGHLIGLALTIGAGGVGITLTRAAHVVVGDRSWVPSENLQAEDRLCRIGQKRPVLVTRILARHPVDMWMSRALDRKAKILAASVEAAAVGVEESK